MNAITNKFNPGDRVKQHATHPDRDFFGLVERTDGNEPASYLVRWHRGYATWEIEADLAPAEANP